jgi:hypothetical protein
VPKKQQPINWKILKAKLKISKPASRTYKIYETQLNSENNAYGGRLTSQEVAEITQYQIDRVGEDHALRTEQQQLSSDLVQSPKMVYQHAAKLCKQVLDDPTIKINSLANIGARVDIVSSYLAANYPKIQFTSVDFQPDLDKHNQLLPQSSNWSFLSGYALDLFENGQLKCDLALFSSTVILFRYQELMDYLKVMKSIGVKALVFNDAWWHPSSPETLDPKKVYVAGPHSTYHYNLPAILSEFGYETKLSQFVDCQEMNLYQLIAYQK